MVAEALGNSYASVAAHLTVMTQSRAVSRNNRRPFVYTLSGSPPVAAPPIIAPISLRKETKLADEQMALAALTAGQASDREALFKLLEWTPHRLGQTLDRLHSAGLIQTVHGSYVLILRRP